MKNTENMLGVDFGNIKAGGELSKEWISAMRAFNKMGKHFREESDRKQRLAMEVVGKIVIGE